MKPHVMTTLPVLAALQAAVALVLLLLAGCGGVEMIGVDAGMDRADSEVWVDSDAGPDLEDSAVESDSSIPVDAGPGDSGPADTGVDSAMPDSGPVDAGPGDSGAEPDAGSDAGSVDSGVDAGPYVPDRPYPRPQDIQAFTTGRCLRTTTGQVWCWGRWGDGLELHYVGRASSAGPSDHECFRLSPAVQCLTPDGLVAIPGVLDRALVPGSTWRLGCTTDHVCWEDGVVIPAAELAVAGTPFQPNVVTYDASPLGRAVCGLLGGSTPACRLYGGGWNTTYWEVVRASSGRTWVGSALCNASSCTTYDGTTIAGANSNPRLRAQLTTTHQHLFVRRHASDIIWSMDDNHDGVPVWGFMEDEHTFCMVLRYRDGVVVSPALECWRDDPGGRVDVTPRHVL